MPEDYDAERFRFFVSTDTSVSYNHMAESRLVYRIPLSDNSFDLVFSNSLLTHLLEAELENYLRESYRLLRAGGAMMHSHFRSAGDLRHAPYFPAPHGQRADRVGSAAGGGGGRRPRNVADGEAPPQVPSTTKPRIICFRSGR